MKLSILICTLIERKEQFEKLIAHLSEQAKPFQGKVEILFLQDDRKMPVGRKRNTLVESSTGDYICFVDDDDWVQPTFIQSILSAIETEPDCIGFEGIITFDGKNPKKFIHSISCKEWYEKDGVYYRTPNHLNPVKRDIALKCPFPETNFGEDKCYSDLIKTRIQTEVMITNTMYFYNYVESKSATRGRT